jgi:hypothetical protein
VIPLAWLSLTSGMTGHTPGGPRRSSAAPTASFSGGSATIASVVRMFLAIDAAFWSAERECPPMSIS